MNENDLSCIEIFDTFVRILFGDLVPQLLGFFITRLGGFVEICRDLNSGSARASFKFYGSAKCLEGMSGSKVELF